MKLYDVLRNGTEGIAKFYQLQPSKPNEKVSGEIELKVYITKRRNMNQLVTQFEQSMQKFTQEMNKVANSLSQLVPNK